MFVLQWDPLTQWVVGPRSPTFHGTLLEPPQKVPNFTLTNQDGRPFQLAEQLDKTMVLFFGYASCPDVCPQTLVDFKRVKSELGTKANDVQFVFITIDPERDTPKMMKQYLEIFDPSFVGLSDSITTMQPVWEAYGVLAEKTDPDKAGNYWVIHSSYTYVIDTDGHLRVIYPFDTPPENIAADLIHLIG